jgi:hypothetical protein
MEVTNKPQMAYIRLQEAIQLKLMYIMHKHDRDAPLFKNNFQISSKKRQTKIENM